MAEDLVGLAVVASEPRHVLDDAGDGEVDLLGHVGRPLGDLLGRRLRGGDHHHLGPGEELGHRQGDVARPRRHVDDQELGLVPPHVGQELLQGLVEHRPPPDDGLVLPGEEAHGDQLHAVRRRRHDQRVDEHRGPFDPQHPGHGEAPDVGVDGGHRVAGPGQGDRQVGGDRRLADPPLARRHRQHPGAGGEERVLLGRPGARRLEQAGQRLLLGFAHHRQVDGHRTDPRDGRDGGRDPVPQLAAEGVLGRGHRHRDPDEVVVDRDRLHHLEVDDRTVELRVLYRSQGLQDGRLGEHS